MSSSTRAIVRIGYGMQFVAPSVDVATKLVGLLSKCQRVEEAAHGWVVAEPESDRTTSLYRVRLDLIPADQLIQRIPKSRRIAAPSPAAPPLDPGA